MSAERWDELKEAFDALVDLTPAERSGRLAAIGVSNPQLHRRLSALFDGDARADSVLAPFESAAGVHPETDATPPAAPTARDPLGFLGRTVSHFRVLDVLGSGGMGVVYRAQDERLGRIVALKFPLPQYSADEAAKERFLKEARAASALDHPSLCTAYESGETDTGHPFLAMACYTGETLRARLAREGALPIGDALDIARALLRGLEAAHGAGVVHRDLKPGNVILTADGGVKILDFGLAKVRDPSITAPEQRPGTVAYMSPEQLEGVAVDGRSDLWSFGVVFYEMLTGKPAFGKGHDLSTVYSILHDDPPPPSRLRAGCPAACDDVVAGLLRRNPDERFANAGAVLAALSGEAVASAPDTAVVRPTARRRAGLRVSAAIASIAAIGAVVLLALLGKARLFAESRSVLSRLHAGTAVAPHVPDAETLRLFREASKWMALRGRSHLDSTIAFLRVATARDSVYAPAWALLGNASAAKFDLADPSPALLASADAAADRAIALDSNFAAGYVAKGMVLSSHGSRAAFDSADVAFRRGIALDSNSDHAHHVYSLLLTMVGRIEDATRENQASLLIQTLGPPQRNFRGVLLFLKGQRALALDTMRAAAGISAEYVVPFYYLGIIEADDGHFRQALKDLTQARATGVLFPGVQSALAYVYRGMGRKTEMSALLASMRADTSNDRARIDRALSWAVMGDVDSAYAKLGTEVWDLPTVHNVIVNPLLKEFREDHRFDALAKRIGIRP
jgi:tetratricopeptide (TPR) repeat protein